MTNFHPRYLRQKLDYLMTNRSQLESEWTSVLRIARPTQTQLAYFRNRLQNTQNPITSQRYRSLKQVFDNHGATASLTLASYLHSSLTNPHEDWMQLQLGTVYQLPDLGVEDVEGRALAQEVYTIKRVLQFFSDQFHLEWQAANFHQEVFSFYKYLVDLGTSCFGVYLNKSDPLNWEFSAKCCSR